MKKFIHLRGAMATGKTSTARSFMSRGKYEVRFINVGGKEYPYTYDEKQNRIVTGRYDTRTCGGLDGVIENREIMKHYLYKLMAEINPDVIVFEAVMYGTTFKFGKELVDICRMKNYEYVGVVLSPDFDVILANMYKRNGGKQINTDRLLRKYFDTLRSADKLIAIGVKIVVEDSSKYELAELYKVIEKWI